jgi:hypothetical protein
MKIVGALATVAVVVVAGSLAAPPGTMPLAVRTPLPIELAVTSDDAAPVDGAVGDEVARDGEDVLVSFVDSGMVPGAAIDGAVVELPPASATVDSADLGAGATITLLRPAGRREIDIAVSDGLVLTAFKTTVIVPGAVHEIQLDMAIDGGSVFSATVAGGSTEELTFTLDTPISTDTTLAISVEERYGATCTSAAVEPSAVRLVENEFLFERVDARPETIADFFPAVLHEAIVVIDPDADSSVRSASFELATALARRYPSVPRLDVVHLASGSTALLGPRSATVVDPPILGDPFTRTIVIAEGERAQMEVVQRPGGAHLRISGPPGLLEYMAASVSAPELAFITKSSVQVEELGADTVPQDLLAQRSLRDVGVRRLVASGSRVLELPISLPQAAFGEPIDEIRVRLGGVAIASSTQGQDPVLSLWFNGDLQDSIDYDDSGRFDLEFVVGPSQIARDNVIVVRSELPLDCGDELPNHELTLDAASWVDAEPGQSLPVSLDRFPQVAVGHLAVAVGPSEDELELAMIMVGVLQGSSPLPIHPQTAPIERVISGFSPGLVVTNGQGRVADAVARDLTTVRSEQLAFVSGESPEDLAFLSTSITDTSQDVLVVFSPSAELSETFTGVATERGWPAFVGRAVGVRGNGDIITSKVSAAAANEAALATLVAAPEEQTSIARQFGLGALAALLLAIAVFMVRFVLGALRRLK